MWCSALSSVPTPLSVNKQLIAINTIYTVSSSEEVFFTFALILTPILNYLFKKQKSVFGMFLNVFWFVCLFVLILWNNQRLIDGISYFIHFVVITGMWNISRVFWFVFHIWTKCPFYVQRTTVRVCVYTHIRAWEYTYIPVDLFLK